VQRHRTRTHHAEHRAKSDARSKITTRKPGQQGQPDRDPAGAEGEDKVTLEDEDDQEGDGNDQEEEDQAEEEANSHRRRWSKARVSKGKEKKIEKVLEIGEEILLKNQRK
jgi:hypothetical protein